MAEIGSFESKLREVVEGKRLSASRMKELTEIAMRSMENDTQLVSVLYRTHKSLPPAAKVSSLYVFDALSRAARMHATKHSLTGDITSSKGNTASFLLKIESVLEGLFQDMITSGSPELKEKTQKILDIWVKGSTFPTAVLARLREVVKADEKETEVDPATIPTTRPNPNAQGPGTSITPTEVSGSRPLIDPVQSTLLALLTQAAAATAPGTQTPTNTAPATATSLDPAQLALLQQLTQTAQLVNGASTQGIPLPLPSFIPQSVPQPNLGGLTGAQPPYRDDRFDSGQRESRYGRYDGSGRGRGHDGFQDEHVTRVGPRGGYRGRGDGRGRWDDRDRYRDRDRSPPRERHSRSRSPLTPRSPRSPARYGGRRDTKTYSPPRRPTMAPLADHEKPRVSETANVDKDEFGRDIRPESPKLAEADSLTVDPVDLKNTESRGDTQTSPPPKMPMQVQLSTGSAATQPIKTHESDPNPYLSGLDKFDVGTFDFRAAASWEALGKLWQISHGYLPSQEELMQFVIARGAAATGPVTSPSMTDQTWPRSDWSNAPGGGAWRGGRGWGRHPRGGRGGFGHGYQKWGHMNMGYETNTSDAIVLGGGSEDYLEEVPAAEDVACTPDEPKVETTKTGGGAGGKMQRVGDKWVFVRDS